MPVIRDAQTNFTAGEFSPLMAARSDVSVYRNGAETLTNLRPLWQGGARTRPAGRYHQTLPQSPARLVPFIFNQQQKYVLAFSNGQVDIYFDDGTSATTVSSAPWTSAQLFEMRFTQVGDTMLIFHEDFPTQILRRTGASSFALSELAFIESDDGLQRFQPFFKFAPSSMTLTPGATTGNGISLVLSGAGAFVQAHVGTIIRYQEKEIEIASVTDANNATGDVRQTLPGTAASQDWDEAVFSAVHGYARSGGFYKNRLVFGGSRDRPTGVWLSQVGDHFNFDLGTALDNEAIWTGIFSDRISNVRHVFASDNLIILTDRAVYAAVDSPDNPIAPDNISFAEQAPFGANDTEPQSFDGAALWATIDGANVYEAKFSDVQQRYQADPVSRLSPHLIKSPVDMAVSYGASERPEQYAILVNNDGSIASFTSLRIEEIAAWTPWQTTGGYKSVCSTGDKLWAAVERTLNSATVLLLEEFDDDGAPLDARAKATNGSPTRSFSGFSHLANEEVAVVSKGHYLGDFTIDGSGNLTLPSSSPAVTEVEVGIAFEQKIRPMPVDFDLRDGPARTLMKRLINATLIVDRTGAASVQGRDVLLDFQGDDFTEEASTTTGQIRMGVMGNDRDAQFDVTVSTPHQITLLGLTRKLEING